MDERDESVSLGSRMRAVQSRATRVRDDLRRVKSAVEAGRSALIALQKSGRAASLPAEAQTAIVERGQELLDASRRLADIAGEIGPRLVEAVRELDEASVAAVAAGDVHRAAAAVTAFEQRIAELEDAFDREALPLLRTVNAIESHLDADVHP